MYWVNSCHSTTGYETLFEKFSQSADIFYGPVQATNNASDYKSGDRKIKFFWAKKPYRLDFGEMDQGYFVQKHREKLCRNQNRVLVDNQGCSRSFGKD